MEGVTTEDVKAIVARQVELAKQGDANAMKFVFEQVLGGRQLRGATFIQNNNYGRAADPGRETKARPGTTSKIDAMSRRAEAGLPLSRAGDADAGDES